jgi:phospholipid/cholesterol/gamma-HCH transport system permease protein
VFPRVLALILVIPLMTLLADLCGILGGLTVAVFGLDLTFDAYVAETQRSVGLHDVFGGFAKSVFFAMTVAFVSCEKGLSTRGGARGVGRATTSAVVSILFYLVALDAVFAVLYEWLGI